MFDEKHGIETNGLKVK